MRITPLLLSLLIVSTRFAAAADTPLPKDIFLIDVLGGKLKADWTLPTGHGQNCLLAVDPAGNPWIGCRDHFLESPAYAAVYMTDRSYTGLTWLADGALLGVSGDQVGLYAIGEAAKSGHAAARCPFQPFGSFPKKTLTLFAGYGNKAYLVASDAQGSDLLVLGEKAGGGTLSKVFHTAQRITAVGGDGNRTYAALGRKIVLLVARPGSGTPAFDAAVVFEHPKAEVTALAYAPKLGLFYSTPKTTGFLGTRYRIQFMRDPGAQIQIAGNSLYVMPASGGVLKLSGVDGFFDHDAELAASGAPVNIELHPETRGE